MSNSRYYITKYPNSKVADLLCDDGFFRPFFSSCGTKDDTSVYKSLSWAEKRLKKISRRYAEACVMYYDADNAPVYLTVQ